MARPIKQGLNYVLLETGFFEDIKLIDLNDRHGPLGEAVFLRLMLMIAKDGYYLELNEGLVLALTRSIGSRWVKNREQIKAVIRDCAECGLLHKGLLNENVITSVGIQKRYAYVKSKQNALKYDTSKYWLLNENEKVANKDCLLGNNNKLVGNPNKLVGNPNKLVDNTTSKVKESKVLLPPLPPKGEERDININNYTVKDIIALCEEVSPILHQRHKSKPNADYAVGKLLDELRLQYSLDDIRCLLNHANKTFHVLPKYKRCDLVYILANAPLVLATEELTADKNEENSAKDNSFLSSNDRTYTAEQLKAMFGEEN